jgi:glutaredoxin 2
MHPGYGYCKEHEMIESPEVRTNIWLQIRRVHNKVSSLREVVKQAEEIYEVSGTKIEADIAYLEIARQLIMKKAEEIGSFTREMTQDLTYISESSAKVKALKSKIDHITDIPVGQVGALIVQVLTAVTQGESVEVRTRIAARARELSNVLVPRLDDKALPEFTRSEEIKQALKVGEKYAEKGNWGDIKDVAGYEVLEPPGAKVKEVPNYKKTHPRIKRPPTNGDAHA